jgi:hypothetical protein
MEFESAPRQTLLAGRADGLDAGAATRLAAHPLESVDTEYPHYVRTVEGPGETHHPREAHPVFHGCYDWHSAVHSHWCLARLCRLFDHPDADAIAAGFDERFTDERVAGEVAYLEANPTFEKPYGWGWLLRLDAELALWDDPRADEWRWTLRPLTDLVVERVASRFLTEGRPHRVGTHGNSAFALACVHDYATVTGADDLREAVAETTRRFYRGDTDAPLAYEPFGWDFLSPALAEADLVRRLLDADEFAAWLEGFLPDAPAALDAHLDPVTVPDDEDPGAALHLAGLNCSRAWCLVGVADALGDHPWAAAFERRAGDHAARGVADAFVDDYAGAHWLSSFVCYLVTREDGGIAPG